MTRTILKQSLGFGAARFLGFDVVGYRSLITSLLLSCAVTVSCTTQEWYERKPPAAGALRDRF